MNDTTTTTAPPKRTTLSVLARRWPTLLGVAAAALIIVATSSLTSLTEFLPPLTVIPLLALIYLAWSLVRRERRGLQLVGTALFAAVAALVVVVDPMTGRWLVGGAWIAHAAWDVYHYRRNEVVPRWYSELCAVIDLLVGVTVIVAPTLTFLA